MREPSSDMSHDEFQQAKEVATRYPVLPVFTDRWSPRSYSPRMPEVAKLQSLFEAARLAPSAHNAQPARFLLARRGRGEDHPTLVTCLDEHNRWAEAAPVLVLAAASRERFSQQEGDFVPYSHFMHDLGLAVMSLILQGRALDLFCHPMAAFDPVKARERFSIPALFEPALVIAVGYRGPPDQLAGRLRERELALRYRRPLEELVFESRWGDGSPLFGTPTADGEETP